MKEGYIPHQNLENPKMLRWNNRNDPEIFYDRYKVNKYNLEKSLNTEKESIENNNIQLNDENAENIKLTIYQQLNLVSNQLLQAREQIKYLSKENQSLKSIIAEKDKIIAGFEELSLKLKKKFEKLENINIYLKETIKNKNFDNNNLIIDGKNLIDNEDLIGSIQSIKGDLDYIEDEYKIKLREKECQIIQLNNQINDIYHEYIKLSEVLDELNYVMKNSDYNQLKCEYNCLLREKEILLEEKEKNHEEIIKLREQIVNMKK